MPYVNIKITREGHVTPEQKAALIRGVTDLLANILHKIRLRLSSPLMKCLWKTGASAAIRSLLPERRIKRNSVSP